MIQVTKKLLDKFGTITKNEVTNLFELVVIPMIKDIIYDDYNRFLTNMVTDSRSKTRPEDYLDEFMEAIDNFEFLISLENGVKLVVPDMDNFKFTGRLSIIENILEGVTGVYYEINGEDYESMFGKIPPNEDPIDKFVSKKERIYLKKRNEIPKDRQKEFVRYPFSNQGPKDIFSQANEFVEDNMQEWIGTSIETAAKNKGAIL